MVGAGVDEDADAQCCSGFCVVEALEREVCDFVVREEGPDGKTSAMVGVAELMVALDGAARQERLAGD